MDPLVNSGAVAAFQLLPSLAKCVSLPLLRVLLVLPNQATTPDASMDTTWSYAAGLSLGAIYDALRPGMVEGHGSRGAKHDAAAYAQAEGDKDFDDAANDPTLNARPQWKAAQSLGRLAIIPRGEWVALGDERATTLTMVASQLSANQLWFDRTRGRAEIFS